MDAIDKKNVEGILGMHHVRLKKMVTIIATAFVWLDQTNARMLEKSVTSESMRRRMAVTPAECSSKLTGMLDRVPSECICGS